MYANSYHYFLSITYQLHLASLRMWHICQWTPFLPQSRQLLLAVWLLLAFVSHVTQEMSHPHLNRIRRKQQRNDYIKYVPSSNIIAFWGASRNKVAMVVSLRFLLDNVRTHTCKLSSPAKAATKEVWKEIIKSTWNMKRCYLWCGAVTLPQPGLPCSR
jgi:hypothetical protein